MSPQSLSAFTSPWLTLWSLVICGAHLYSWKIIRNLMEKPWVSPRSVGRAGSPTIPSVLTAKQVPGLGMWTARSGPWPTAIWWRIVNDGYPVHSCWSLMIISPYHSWYDEWFGDNANISYSLLLVIDDDYIIISSPIIGFHEPSSIMKSSFDNH